MTPTSRTLRTTAPLSHDGDISIVPDMSSRVSLPEEFTTNADEVRQRWLDRMPSHWRTPRHPMTKPIFSLLSARALGQPDLTELWVACRTEESFRVYRDRVIERINRVTIVCALLLIPLAILVSTAPPRPGIVNYSIRGPYILLWNSLGTLLANVIIGLAILNIFSGITREAFVDTSMRKRAHVYCVLVVMGSPFQQASFATILAIVGLLVAAFISHDTIMQSGAIFNVLLPAQPLLVYLAIVWFSGSKTDRAPNTLSAISLEVIEVERKKGRNEEV